MARVHAEQVAGKDRSLVAARARAYLEKIFGIVAPARNQQAGQRVGLDVDARLDRVSSCGERAQDRSAAIERGVAFAFRTAKLRSAS
jgi:hypothetical protein